MLPLTALIERMPKAELHMHLEGSLEPDLMFKLARRNNVALRYRSEAELCAAYNFTNLQSFLDIYYAGLTVLRTQQDFYDMTAAYCARVHLDHVVHAEVFISPQAHTRRGIAFAEMFHGIDAALRDAHRNFKMSTRLLVGIQRQYSEDEAMAMVDVAVPFQHRIAGLGLGGPEVGHPPSKFARVFARARTLGWRCVAHAGEEGPASYVAEAIDVLNVDRIDHGVHCEDDPALVRRLADLKVPLTVCPISNLKLRVVPDLAQHNLARLLRAGVHVTINSDDPSYFDGYMTKNFTATQAALGLTADEVYVIARNGFLAAFLSEAERARHLDAFDAHWRAAGVDVPRVT